MTFNVYFFHTHELKFKHLPLVWYRISFCSFSFRSNKKKNKLSTWI